MRRFWWPETLPRLNGGMMKTFFYSVFFVSLGVVAYWSATPNSMTKQKKEVPANAKIETAVFAGGCFWCVEANFEKVEGVIEAVSGYTGGETENPTYAEVCSHQTEHLEAVEVTFDANQVAYNDLLEVFWRTIDPTDDGGSFVDRGNSYTSAIFVANSSQRKFAEQSKQRLADSGRFAGDIVTPIRELTPFYVAEGYHQDYYLANPIKYKMYRYASGRDQFIRKNWGKDAKYKVMKMAKTESKSGVRQWSNKPVADFSKPENKLLKEQLSEPQYYVTQKEGTEQPFSNEFWDEKKDGIFVDVVSGEPLFSSREKFASGTGWPSFFKPLVEDNITEKLDRSIFGSRVEVRSKHADSHLGHVFKDGPAPTGLRYCINSAALRFIPVEDLVAEGYGFFSKIFQDEVVQTKSKP